jgi:diaminohydroxyphosphoribosylaminopyrimidine deaminase/5-amino-6-(5-phosphoribosylamino)uracil reductase
MTSTPQQFERDLALMSQALEQGAQARLRSSPNPWVGCVIVTTSGEVFKGSTEPAGLRHAEIVALDAAHASGIDTNGATVYTTLEPCSHHGRTRPCTDALIEAGVSRVVSALLDPDPLVSGQGFENLRRAGVSVDHGIGAEDAHEQLHSYLHHRRTGQPFVIMKIACTLDGCIAAADGSSQWITGDLARQAAHQLRAESDAIVVGAKTVRTDDPSLTTRLVDGPSPRRVVLGTAPPEAKVHPCLEWNGSLPDLLHTLGTQGVLQLMVEGGASVASSFHELDLVDRYIFHIAPAIMGGGGLKMFTGQGAVSIQDLWRGHVRSTRLLGSDIEIVLDRQAESLSPSSHHNKEAL